METNNANIIRTELSEQKKQKEKIIWRYPKSLKISLQTKNGQLKRHNWRNNSFYFEN